MNFELFMCVRNLTSKGKNSFVFLVNSFMIIGISLGVMVLIVVTATISGFKSEFEYKILNLNPHIHVIKKEKQNISNYHRIISMLTKVDNVKSINPVIHSQVFLRSLTGISGVILKGIDFEDPIYFNSNFFGSKSDITNYYNIIKQDEEKFIPIILGCILAEKLNVSIGDLIYSVPFYDNIFNSIPFKVVSLFSTGMYQYDKLLAYVPLSDMQVILNMNGSVNGIEIKLKNISKTKKTTTKIGDVLGNEFLVTNWIETNFNLFSLLKIQKITMFIIFSLILFVAALGVASSLIMVIMVKAVDIAILKFMGVSNFIIKKIFVFQGMIMSFLGTIIGILFGLCSCVLLNKYKFITLPGNIYILDTLPVNLCLKDVLIVFLTTIIICFIFTIFTVNRVSLLNSVDIITKK